MPIRYEVEGETGIVVSRVTGSITLGEMRAHVDRMLGDPALKRPVRVLADLRMRESIPSAGELRRAVAYVSAELLGSRHRVAFVVSREVLFGMGTEVFFETAGLRDAIGAIKARVFYDIEEARGWLRGEGEP